MGNATSPLRSADQTQVRVVLGGEQPPRFMLEQRRTVAHLDPNTTSRRMGRITGADRSGAASGALSNARLLRAAGISPWADAGRIGCWEAQYFYVFWRPG